MVKGQTQKGHRPPLSSNPKHSKNENSLKKQALGEPYAVHVRCTLLFTPLLGSPRASCLLLLSSSLLLFVLLEQLRIRHQLRSKLLPSKVISMTSIQRWTRAQTKQNSRSIKESTSTFNQHAFNQGQTCKKDLSEVGHGISWVDSLFHWPFSTSSSRSSKAQGFQGQLTCQLRKQKVI